MTTIVRESTALLLIDFQAKLMPAIESGASIVTNARRLLTAADMFDVPVLLTEQNVPGLGPTIPELRHERASIVRKMTFDACRTHGFLEALPDRPALIVAGCETHVCVAQTVLGLLSARRQVFIVRDALGSRRTESKETAIRRMEHNGAEVVTTEMVVFEWLATADDARLRDVLALVR
jgi:nicotinamidase-related amidase